MNGQIALISHDVYVGNCHACQKHSGEFDKVIHIWHETQGGYCFHKRESGLRLTPGNLSIEYEEGKPLTDDVIEAVYAFSGEGKILIHCAAGIGRSSTLAPVILAARGVNFFDSLGMIARAEWEQYTHKHCPHYHCKRLNEIIGWLNEHEKNPV